MGKYKRVFLFITWLVILAVLLASLSDWLWIIPLQTAESRADGNQSSSNREEVSTEVAFSQVPSSNRMFSSDNFANPARIGKVTMVYGESNPGYEQALQSHMKHAEEHGYPVMVLRQKLLRRVWSKPAYLLSIILSELQKPEAEQLKWLFWFDADTVILNQRIPLEIFLPPAPKFEHIHFLCGFDHNGLNDGAFLLRVSDYALHLMAAALSVETFRPTVDLRYSCQSAVQHLVTSTDVVRLLDNFTYAQGFAKIPQRWFNAYMGPRTLEGVVKPKNQLKDNSVKEGDMLVHFVGGGATKQKRMIKFLKALRKDPESWLLDLRDTEYEAEISDFWREESKTSQKGNSLDDRTANHEAIHPVDAESQTLVSDTDQSPPAEMQSAGPQSIARLQRREEHTFDNEPDAADETKQVASTTVSVHPNLPLVTWNGWEVMPGKIRSEKFKAPKLGYAGR